MTNYVTSTMLENVIRDLAANDDFFGITKPRLVSKTLPASSFVSAISATPETPENISKLHSALEYLDPNSGYGSCRMYDLSGEPETDYWVAAVWAIRSLNWNCGEAIAREWSKQSYKYDDEAFDKAWSDFNPNHSNPIGIGSLYKRAQDNGWIWNSTNSSISQSTNESDWGEPIEIGVTNELQPYPKHQLPAPIKAAVDEVQDFVQAPYGMVATAAISAISLAAQSSFDVRRTHGLEGPVGTYALTIADSGERKSSIDNHFTKALQQFESDQIVLNTPKLDQYETDLASWTAIRDGKLMQIKAEAKKGRPTQLLKQDLFNHQQLKPTPPKIPRILFTDTTPEALQASLANKWPSAGVFSSEAGLVLGSHGMSADSVLRNLAFLNQAWDGKTFQVDRKTSDSLIIKDPRMTVSLQTQSAAVKNFIKKTGELARGTGFLARFLVCEPKSTQGTRFFKEAPEQWPEVNKFNHRVLQLLNNQTVDEDGLPIRTMLKFDNDAKQAWIKFSDKIEEQLSDGEFLSDIRDVASKCADNVARVSALFHVFEKDNEPQIGFEHVEQASAIVSWHLLEAKRIYRDLDEPEDVKLARTLDKWLIDHCNANKTDQIGRNKVLQNGPYSLRSKSALDQAMLVLVDLNRANVTADQTGKSFIEVNPALLAS